MVSDVFLEQLRNACPLEEIARTYVDLKRRGRTYVCNCPFHSEKTPSFTVFPDTQSFYCFGCGAGGDVITFIQQIENLDFMDAVKLLAQNSGLTVPEQGADEKQSRMRKRILAVNRAAANFYYRMLTGSDKRGLQYFIQRHLTTTTIKKYGLGFAPETWDALSRYLLQQGFTEEELLLADVSRRSRRGTLIDTFRNRVIFPIVDLRGNVIGFGGRVLDDSQPKYLNTAQTPVFDKGKNLFSLQFAKNSVTTTLILAEGYMDVIAVHQAGFENVVATLGTAITPDQARKISQYAKTVIIAYDSDAAGQAATQKAMRHFSEVGIETKILRMQGAKDPDEYIRKFGAERFRMLLEGSEDAINFQLDRCEMGLDLQTENGRATLLRRATEVLIQIPDPVTREVYLMRTAEKCHISADVLRMSINRKQKNRQQMQKKKEFSNLVAHTVTAQQTAADASGMAGSSRTVRAQERLLCYFLSQPEQISKLADHLQPEQFTVPFYQKLFQLLLEHQQQESDGWISALGMQLTPQEMGTVSRLLNLKQTCPISPQEVQDCIQLLQTHLVQALQPFWNWLHRKRRRIKHGNDAALSALERNEESWKEKRPLKN